MKNICKIDFVRLYLSGGILGLALGGLIGYPENLIAALLGIVLAAIVLKITDKGVDDIPNKC